MSSNLPCSSGESVANLTPLTGYRAEPPFRQASAAPSGLGSVQTFSGRQINVGLDGTIEMSAEDAQYYIRDGWTKLAEWTTEDAV